MADPRLVDILKQGSEVWNRWREQQPGDLWIDLSGAVLNGSKLSESNLSRVDLRRADLRDAGLYEANLHKANLHEAILRGAHLHGASMYEAKLISADLYETDLRGADLHEADLRESDLSEARLTGANLHKADLRWADLTRTDLSCTDLGGADLTFAQFFATIVANTDLCQTRGLAQINHQGPSNLTLHSIQLPQDGSAIHFLRGAGVPDEWINDYRAHMLHPIQYHSCFISNAHQDDALAKRLHSDLQARGVGCWSALHDMHIGDKIRSCINEEIHIQDKLLLVLSEYSIASDWVEHEVETALGRERRERRTILFPIRLDNAILERPHTGWAALVQNERHIGDFTGWKDHGCYQTAFDRLMHDLKKADEKSA
jgi:TIR domain-containing protein/pentapeptide repeat protein